MEVVWFVVAEVVLIGLGCTSVLDTKQSHGLGRESVLCEGCVSVSLRWSVYMGAELHEVFPHAWSRVW